jgi:dTDP-4-dehydrorhamnose 3,5-epimerase
VRFTALPLADAYLVDVEPHTDERGLFARTFDADEFARRGLAPAVAQCSVSFNLRRGTVRGMHWLAEPAREAKLVRCTRGAVHDVIVDMRPASSTYLRHVAVELSAANRTAIYIPPQFAHGFQTLEDATEVSYQMSEPYVPGHERGLRHDDPALAIAWPLSVSVVSVKDRAWPALRAAAEERA